MPGFAQLLCRWRRVAQRSVTTGPAELDRTDGSRPDAEVLAVRAESAETAQLTPPLARRQRRRLHLTPQIVERTDGTAGFVVPARRWVAEGTLSRLMRSCRLVRDYGTLPARHEAMVLWPMAMLISGRPAGRRPVGFRRPTPWERGTLPAAPGGPTLAPPGVSPSIAVPRLSPAPYPARERQPVADTACPRSPLQSAAPARSAGSPARGPTRPCPSPAGALSNAPPGFPPAP